MFGSEAKSLIIEKFSMTLKSQGEFIYTFERKWNEVKRLKEKFRNRIHGSTQTLKVKYVVHKVLIHSHQVVPLPSYRYAFRRGPGGFQQERQEVQGEFHQENLQKGYKLRSDENNVMLI